MLAPVPIKHAPRPSCFRGASPLLAAQPEPAAFPCAYDPGMAANVQSGFDTPRLPMLRPPCLLRASDSNAEQRLLRVMIVHLHGSVTVHRVRDHVAEIPDLRRCPPYPCRIVRPVVVRARTQCFPPFKPVPVLMLSTFDQTFILATSCRKCARDAPSAHRSCPDRP